MQQVFFEINEDGSEAATSTGRTSDSQQAGRKDWGAAVSSSIRRKKEVGGIRCLCISEAIA